MAVAKIIVDNKNFEFDIETKRSTDIYVSRNLYDLLELKDDEGFYNTHRTNQHIEKILEYIENDGLKEYIGIGNSDVDLLKACSMLFKADQVDEITFIEE